MWSGTRPCLGPWRWCALEHTATPLWSHSKSKRAGNQAGRQENVLGAKRTKKLQANTTNHRQQKHKKKKKQKKREWRASESEWKQKQVTKHKPTRIHKTKQQKNQKTECSSSNGQKKNQGMRGKSEGRKSGRAARACVCVCLGVLLCANQRFCSTCLLACLLLVLVLLLFRVQEKQGHLRGGLV